MHNISRRDFVTILTRVRLFAPTASWAFAMPASGSISASQIRAAEAILRRFVGSNAVRGISG
jgi:hypothetical protein